jgi:hypothetical protein
MVYGLIYPTNLPCYTLPYHNILNVMTALTNKQILWSTAAIAITILLWILRVDPQSSKERPPINSINQAQNQAFPTKPLSEGTPQGKNAEQQILNKLKNLPKWNPSTITIEKKNLYLTRTPNGDNGWVEEWIIKSPPHRLSFHIEFSPIKPILEGEGEGEGKGEWKLPN